MIMNDKSMMQRPRVHSTFNFKRTCKFVLRIMLQLTKSAITLARTCPTRVSSLRAIRCTL